MNTDGLQISGPIKFATPRIVDARGYFSETFNLSKMQGMGVTETSWVQDNQSYSKEEFTLRGLHLQLPPFAQAKIVRVLRGNIFDAVVDLRQGSSTFGQWQGFTLSAEDMSQLYIPQGFAHGFLTLERDVVVSYKVSNFYSQPHDRSLHWADSTVAIKWPLPVDVEPVLSTKDDAAPGLDALKPELGAFQ